MGISSWFARESLLEHGGIPTGRVHGVYRSGTASTGSVELNRLRLRARAYARVRARAVYVLRSQYTDLSIAKRDSSVHKGDPVLAVPDSSVHKGDPVQPVPDSCILKEKPLLEGYMDTGDPVQPVPDLTS